MELEKNPKKSNGTFGMIITIGDAYR